MQSKQQIGLTRCLGHCRTIWARAFRCLPLPHSLLRVGGNDCIVAYQLPLRNWQHCTGAFKNRSLLFYAVFAQTMPINLGYLDGSELPRVAGWRKGCPPMTFDVTHFLSAIRSAPIRLPMLCRSVAAPRRSDIINRSPPNRWREALAVMASGRQKRR
jgi:hypothetical protein